MPFFKPRANPFANLFLHRVLFKSACAVLLPLCALTAVAVSAASAWRPHTESAQRAEAEWPQDWQGAPLRPLALSAVERRFAERFPGTLARLTDGEQVIVMRRVRQATRMLHPAADCYQGLGWRVENLRLEQQALDGTAGLWRCFEAVDPASGERLRVCERIEDAQGQAFTDTSAWYWAAALGQSHGPWQAITIARPI